MLLKDSPVNAETLCGGGEKKEKWLCATGPPAPPLRPSREPHRVGAGVLLSWSRRASTMFETDFDPRRKPDPPPPLSTPLAGPLGSQTVNQLLPQNKSPSNERKQRRRCSCTSIWIWTVPPGFLLDPRLPRPLIPF